MVLEVILPLHRTGNVDALLNGTPVGSLTSASIILFKKTASLSIAPVA